MPTNTPKIDALLLPGEQVLFRASRGIRTSIWLGKAAFAATLAACLIIAGLHTKGLGLGLLVGAVSAFLATGFRPRAQIIVTDARLIIRSGLVPAPAWVGPLATIAGIERSMEGKIEIVWRDGDRLDVGNLPSLAEMLAVIVEQTGIEPPIFLPKRLRVWPIVVRTAYVAGISAGVVLIWHAIRFICQSVFPGLCVDVTGGPVFYGLLFSLIIPTLHFGAVIGLGIVVAIFRLTLSPADTGMIFNVVYPVPKSSGWLARLTIAVLCFPPLLARRLASMLYGKAI